MVERSGTGPTTEDGSETMKMKVHLVITEPADFAMGKFDYSVHLYENDPHIEDWIHVGIIELDFGGIDLTEAKRLAIEKLDQEIETKRAEFSKVLEALQAKKNSLLALEHTND